VKPAVHGRVRERRGRARLARAVGAECFLHCGDAAVQVEEPRDVAPREENGAHCRHASPVIQLCHMIASDVSPPQAPWLLLIHRLPPEPAYLRVKVRRRLQRIGARLVKNSVYVLPQSEEALEDFQWLAREIAAEDGEAIVCEASFVAGITNDELVALFERRPAATSLPGEPPDRVEPGRVWVTRQNVFVDRIASAWLIRRFIDPQAGFKFVPPRGYVPSPGELRFDMYEAEYTHEGDRCTFETLMRRFGLKERALRTIAEIVHDIDCKDDKYERPEAAGVASVLRGISRAYADDMVRVERGAALFDDLYARFRKERA
jgi:hypothetical protein